MGDWDTVTYIGKRQNAGPSRNATEAEVNQARRSGSTIETEKRCTAHARARAARLAGR